MEQNINIYNISGFGKKRITEKSSTKLKCNNCNASTKEEAAKNKAATTKRRNRVNCTHLRIVLCCTVTLASSLICEKIQNLTPNHH